jgi:hypothetical protein
VVALSFRSGFLQTPVHFGLWNKHASWFAQDRAWYTQLVSYSLNRCDIVWLGWCRWGGGEYIRQNGYTPDTFPFPYGLEFDSQDSAILIVGGTKTKLSRLATSLNKMGGAISFLSCLRVRYPFLDLKSDVSSVADNKASFRQRHLRFLSLTTSCPLALCWQKFRTKVSSLIHKVDPITSKF